MINLLKNNKVKIHGPHPRNLKIRRDTHGVPHIEAESIDDSNWGLGYCHAVDRGMQLQFMRILGQGRLCELLEDSEDNLKVDRFIRRMGWKHNIDKVLAELEPETLSWCQSLCDGINAGFQSKKLSLMRLLAGAPEPWTIADSILIFRMSGYLTLAQTQGESERLFIELVQNGVSDEKLASLFPIQDQEYDRALIEKITLPERALPLELLWQSSVPRMMASNSWVVSGERTESGMPIMANDPHLEVNRLPNVWYEAVLNCNTQAEGSSSQTNKANASNGYHGMGYGMPGIPGLLIGRTKQISWGATYTFADTVDSWIEECKDGKYKRGKSWRKFNKRQEIILRKNHPLHVETCYENSHGVLDGNPLEAGFYLSTLWSPAHYGAQGLNAARALVNSSNARDAQLQLGKIESAWNWVIADNDGNIAYQMSGLCPKRKHGWNGFVPGLGWDKNYDWSGFHKLEDLPSSYNPERGFFVTANQDLNEFGKVKPINMPMSDHRARRIDALLSRNTPQTLSSTRAIQMDTQSLQAAEFMKVLGPILNETQPDCLLAQILLEWGFHYNKHSTGASLFEDFYAALRQCVFQDEQISPQLTKHLREQTCLFIDFYQNFDRCLLDSESIWYHSKSQEEYFTEAFEKAKNNFVPETWGERNRFNFTNILFQGKLPEYLRIDSTELPMIGSRATPHQGQLYESAGRKTSFAASVRIAADMSETCLHSRTAGGVSDNPLSPWYMSEVQGWLSGSFKKLEF